MRQMFRLLAMRAGTLSKKEEEAGRWEFVRENGEGAGTRKEKLAASLLWKVELDGESIQLRLTPYDGSDEIVVPLHPVDGKISAVMLNEPTKDEFCKQAPTSRQRLLFHFDGIYRLVGPPLAANERIIPRLVGRQGPCEVMRVRPPKICMTVLFDATKQTW